MHSFTQEYLAVTDIDTADLPYWDLCAALRPAFKMSESADHEYQGGRADARRTQAVRGATFEKLAC